MEAILVAKSGAVDLARFRCQWTIQSAVETRTQGAPAYKCVDLSFSPLDPAPKSLEDIESITVKANNKENELKKIAGTAFAFLVDCLNTSITNATHGCAARLVLPASEGFLVRADILSQRLLDCPGVRKTYSFPQAYRRYVDSAVVDLEDLLRNAIGGILLVATDKSNNNASALGGVSAIDAELRNRLSFPWLLPHLEQKRPVLGLVDAGLRGPDDGGTGGSIYLAAQALGIDIVAIDAANHWVNGEKYRYWRKDHIELYLPLDPDETFADSIVEAVRAYNGHLDTIMTFRDHYKLPVAKAAQKLGLPTYSPEAYAISTDKYQTSVSEGHVAYQAADAITAVKLVKEHNMTFPLIIKPCNGFLSEGVFRVADLEQLEAAANSIDTDRHGREFVIEKYCQGPEVDANIALCDGEVIFFELSDDFPKGADVNTHGNVKNFIELANVLPSALPQAEQDMLRQSLGESLVRMGFQDGFFHLEARVEDSSWVYSTVDGVLDLRPKKESAQQTPSCWLIEVNPRPPGIQESEAVRYTYGVDYFALALLFAAGDKARARALSYPYLKGPQYWCEMVFIPVEKGGVFDSEDVCVRLGQEHPELASHISDSFCFLKKGDKVPDPLETGTNSWVAYFNVVCKESRAEVLRLSEAVRENIVYTIV